MMPDSKENRLKVLLALGDSQEKEAMQHTLATAGYRHMSEETGQKTLAVLNRRFFPVIITEMMFEGVRGLELCKAAKVSRFNKKSFVILVRSEQDHPGPPVGSKHGPDAYLTRPVKTEELIAHLRTGKRVLDLETALIKTRLKLHNKSGNLEMIGKITSGIIHEINTPVQYVTDNLHFLQDAFQDMEKALEIHKDLCLSLKNRGVPDSIMAPTETALENCDLAYLEQEIPLTLRQSLEGLHRIADIVLAVRAMSHPGTGERTPVDMNDTIKSCVLLTKNQWKYVADVQTDLSPKVKPLPFKPGELNQVILNMLINAAHAVSETVKATGEKGTISIATRKEGERVTISIRDTGPGIPETIKSKIFTPFFTTKEVGKGTGQGLAIVLNIIKNHGGTINLESQSGKGATFTLSFPLQQIPGPEILAPREKLTAAPLTSGRNPEQQRILFVDNEPHVLKGLERMLHPMRGEWKMSFAESGRKALELLQNEVFDMVVTDFQMDEMNGLELLTRVKKDHPQTIRMILSGETDQKLIMESVHIAHQFMAKPCNAEKLKANITRAFSLKNILNDNAIIETISKTDALPPLPSLYAEITRELHAENPSIQKIGTLISGDTAMTSKILQLVNSAFFGIATHISSPTQAVIMLGLDTIKALVLNFEIFSRFKLDAAFNPFLQKLTSHNLATGRFARQIAEQKNMNQPTIDQAFMAGLLHDCGKLVLATNFPAPFKEVLALYEKENLSFTDCEKRVFGITHAEVGAYLMGLWGLPVPIVEAIRHHHTPEASIKKGFGITAAVHLSNALAHGKGAKTEEAEKAAIH